MTPGCFFSSVSNSSNVIVPLSSSSAASNKMSVSAFRLSSPSDKEDSSSHDRKTVLNSSLSMLPEPTNIQLDYLTGRQGLDPLPSVVSRDSFNHPTWARFRMAGTETSQCGCHCIYILISKIYYQCCLFISFYDLSAWRGLLLVCCLYKGVYLQTFKYVSF